MSCLFQCQKYKSRRYVHENIYLSSTVKKPNKEYYAQVFIGLERKKSIIYRYILGKYILLDISNEMEHIGAIERKN